MKIVIYGKPIAKKRPRFARRGKFVSVYSDQETEEGRFILMLQQQYNSGPMARPLIVNLDFYILRPKSDFGTGKNLGKLKTSAPKHHVKKPDLDNLEKFTLDCMNGIVYQDDRQVVRKSSWKGYSETPRTEISIREIETQSDSHKKDNPEDDIKYCEHCDNSPCLGQFDSTDCITTK